MGDICKTECSAFLLYAMQEQWIKVCSAAKD